MKYGTHKFSPVYNSNFSKRDNNWVCKICGLEVLKPYHKPPVWRVKNRKFYDYRDAKIPESCDGILMNEALE